MVSIPKKEYERLLAQEAKIEYLQQQLEKLQKLFHGSKSERFIPVKETKPTSNPEPASKGRLLEGDRQVRPQNRRAGRSRQRLV